MYSTRYDDYLWLMLLTGNVQSPWKKYNQYHDQHLLTAVTDFIRQQPWHWTCNVNENSQKLTDLNLRLVLVVLLDQRKSRGTCHWCPLSFYKKAVIVRYLFSFFLFIPEVITRKRCHDHILPIGNPRLIQFRVHILLQKIRIPFVYSIHFKGLNLVF